MRFDLNSIAICRIKTNDFFIDNVYAICRTERGAALNIYATNVEIFLVNYFIRNVCRIKSLLAFWEISKLLAFPDDICAWIRDKGVVEEI